MKNNMIKYMACAAMALGLAATVQAAQITGTITMSGGAIFNTPTVNTATAVTTWVGPSVITSSGLAGVSLGDLVTFYSAWQFTPTVAIPNLWSVDMYSFSLTSSAVSQGGGFLNITGTGTLTDINVSGSTTPFVWSFSSQDPSAGSPPTWSWSASTAGVPDGGMTVMLLGAALSGLALIRRKLA
jgi:hypothetical protein